MCDTRGDGSEDVMTVVMNVFCSEVVIGARLCLRAEVGTVAFSGEGNGVDSVARRVRNLRARRVEILFGGLS